MALWVLYWRHLDSSEVLTYQSNDKLKIVNSFVSSVIMRNFDDGAICLRILLYVKYHIFDAYCCLYMLTFLPKKWNYWISRLSHNISGSVKLCKVKKFKKSNFRFIYRQASSGYLKQGSKSFFQTLKCKPFSIHYTDYQNILRVLQLLQWIQKTKKNKQW